MRKASILTSSLHSLCEMCIEAIYIRKNANFLSEWWWNAVGWCWVVMGGWCGWGGWGGWCGWGGWGGLIVFKDF